MHDGNLYSMSNRRLFVLLMHQAVHRDWAVSAPCILRTKACRSNKFKKAVTTRSAGLGIDAQETRGLKEALHNKRPIFDTGWSAMSLLSGLLTGCQFE